MNFLVLGGAGYIGSHTALELVKAGHEVIIADNLITGYRSAIPKAAKLYEGDISNTEFLDKLFGSEKIDAVIHFAAFSLVGESVTNPLKYYDNNLCGTKVLLEAMVRHGIDKIVFSSTAATYGEPENIPILESDRTCPTNPYVILTPAERTKAAQSANHTTPKVTLSRLFCKCRTESEKQFQFMAPITTRPTELVSATIFTLQTSLRLIYWQFNI